MQYRGEVELGGYPPSLSLYEGAFLEIETEGAQGQIGF